MNNIDFHSFMFLTLALVSIIAALAVVTTQKILRSAVYLIIVLLCSAGFAILLNYEFIAALMVMVFIGGIVVILIFAIMLTSSVELLEDTPSFNRKAIGLATSMAFFVTCSIVFLNSKFVTVFPGPQAQNEVRAIGQQLLNIGPGGFILPFEIVSLLLLVALIGSVVIARKLTHNERGD